MFPIERHTFFLTLGGSQAHGTAHEGSDVDIRGVCTAPLSVRVSLFKSFEQYEGPLPAGLNEAVIPRIEEHPSASRGLAVKAECVIFDVAKFLGLCAAANPNALEVLFADEQDWLLATAQWTRIHEQRSHFLTKKVQQTFLGYALAQLKKIQTHRSWLLNPPAKKPTREDFGLPPHGGRLMRMGLEVLEGGELRVRRDDADQLSAIRDGTLSFDELLSTANTLQDSMQRAASVSTLPQDVDYDWVDALLADVLAIAR